MSGQNSSFDIFVDGMSIFLSYIARKVKGNPGYVEHPLIRAFACALNDIDKLEVGKFSAGVSGDSKGEQYINPYVVVLEKREDVIAVSEIRDLTTGKELPLDVMITLFRIQIKLDRFPGDTVSPQQMADVLSQTIPGGHFYALGDRWKEARDMFREEAMQGKISLPISMKDSGIVEQMTKIKFETPWKDYPNEVRALIGSMAARFLDRRHGTMVITSPVDSKIEKARVFEFATQYYLGKGAEYFTGGESCIFCTVSKVKDHVLALEDEFVILADKYPLKENHILITPRIHVRAMGDLDTHYLQQLSDSVELVERYYSFLGEKLLMFEPGFVGQSVFHAHVHCIPAGSIDISKHVQVMGLSVSEIESLVEVGEFYKQNGSYLLWRQNSKYFITSAEGKEISESFFRSLVASQLLNSQLVSWKGYENDPEVKRRAQAMVQSLKDEWKGWNKV